MSYDICLKDPKTNEVCVLDEPHNMKGGTYQIGGCATAEFNITYNYSKFFYEVFGEKGIRTIYGMSGNESIPLLVEAISKLKEDVSDNYWDATEGNARVALLSLLALAGQCPNGIWHGD